MSTQVPVEEGVFTWPSDNPRLIGSECVSCGTVTFPRQSGCAKCTGSEMVDRELSTRGTLWTWTVQAFPPKSPPYAGNADPDTFTPFGVGYVELPGEVRVESRLTVSDPGQLRIGSEMELVIVPLTTDEHGNEIVTFAFAPVAT